MSKFTRVIGFVWASPLTIVGFIYASLFTLFGWYNRADTYGDAFVWVADKKTAPRWVTHSILWWGGQSIGNVVVLLNDPKSDKGRVILRHEQEHVRQMMVLGVFQPVLYAIASLVIRLACPRSHYHYSNPFEIEARRAAGQVVDVEAALRRAMTVIRLRGAAKKNDAPI